MIRLLNKMDHLLPLSCDGHKRGKLFAIKQKNWGDQIDTYRVQIDAYGVSKLMHTGCQNRCIPGGGGKCLTIYLNFVGVIGKCYYKTLGTSVINSQLSLSLYFYWCN